MEEPRHEGGDGKTYLIVSEGVTAKTASIIPAPRPARRLRGADTLPSPTHARQGLFSRSTELARSCQMTHLSVRERMLEVVVRDEAYARLDGVPCCVFDIPEAQYPA